MSGAGIERERVTGVVLAGGRSSRMFPAAEGPADKGLLDLAGTAMLAHVAVRLAPQVGRVVLNANGDPARFERFGLPVVGDSVPGYAGPLVGLLAGMRWSAAQATHATHIATVPVDAPFIPDDLVAKLAAALRPGGVALAASSERVHPTVGLWPVHLADALEAALSSGTRKMSDWVERQEAAVVAFPDVALGDASIDPFFNVNTPDDLARAIALIGVRSS